MWCGRGDSNPHGLATASPSSWCVCQFRHFREERLLLYLRMFQSLTTHAYCGVEFVGGVAGAAGGGATGAAGTLAGAASGGAPNPPTTEPGPRCPHTANVSDNAMNSAANPAVILVSSVAPARAPNAV